jgi:hypothetical protein
MKVTLGEQLRGPAGHAHELLLGKPDWWTRPEQQATLAAWFLNCPGQSPGWDRYLLSVIHLRPIPRARPAAILVPGATHEVILFALDPIRRPQPTRPHSWKPLLPINVMEQVQLPDDDAARTLLRGAARAVMDGLLPAEPALSGAVEPWRTSMIRTAAHLRGEEHAQ